MEGIYLVDKPTGWTSFDVVNYIRKVVANREGKKPKNVKVGHCGTLDPFATGLLVLLIGKTYTRRAEEFSKLDKTYDVTMRLGEVSTTGDPEGEITPVIADSIRNPESKNDLSGSRLTGQDDNSVSTEAEIKEAMQKFTGEIEQIPPAFSAIKVNGRRAYKLAREGKEVVIEPRKVRINSLELTDYNYPEVKFVTNVSSGTYIRALVEDIGKTLQTGAYTSELRRTTIGDFSIKDAKSVEDLAKSLA